MSKFWSRHNSNADGRTDGAIIIYALLRGHKKQQDNKIQMYLSDIV